VRSLTRRMREICVITELVINHTSDQNPWFQSRVRAVAGVGLRTILPTNTSNVWSDTPEKYKDSRSFLKTSKLRTWAWDPVARPIMASLLFASARPNTLIEIRQCIMQWRSRDFWLGLGVMVFALTYPVPYERENTSCENLPEHTNTCVSSVLTSTQSFQIACCSRRRTNGLKMQPLTSAARTNRT